MPRNLLPLLKTQPPYLHRISLWSSSWKKTTCSLDSFFAPTIFLRFLETFFHDRIHSVGRKFGENRTAMRVRDSSRRAKPRQKPVRCSELPRSARVRFGSVSSLANADWPRQLAGASNDTQRRRAAPPSSRLHAAPPPYGIFSRQQRTAAPSASRANASPSIPRAPHFSPRYPFETAHVPRRPVLRPLFLPVLRVSFDSIFPLSSSPIPLSLSFSALSSISPRACLLLLACSLSFFLGRPRLAQYMLYF